MLHRLALERSQAAEACGALVPLSTEAVERSCWRPFVVRRLLSRTPKHLLAGGPRPNPFLPWDADLEVQPIGSSHLALLNKYPVQRGHLLLITQQWQPQSGWLETADWRALAAMEADTSGLWFFNSCPAAGASQPHRHLQLLPRSSGESSCPLAESIEAALDGHPLPWSWRYRLAPRQASGTDDAAAELEVLYRRQVLELQMGDPSSSPAPLHPYNLLIAPGWFLCVRREREHWAGFSVNALGFAGYLLITQTSDEDWLARHGPLELLRAVAAPED
jgi:ATP adenylyltransferase